MKLPISIDEFDKLKSRQTVQFNCLQCKQKYLLTKHNIQDFLKRGDELSGHFCSPGCRGKYEINRDHIKTNCKYCNKPITRQPKEKRKTSNSFCCSSHSAKYYNQSRKVTLIKLSCPTCKNNFEVKPHRINKNNKHKFCSRKCAAIFHTKARNKGLQNYFLNRPEKYKNIQMTQKVIEQEEFIGIHTPSIKTNCLNCGQETLKSKYQIERNKYNYCSRSCQAIYANKTYNKTGRFGINKSRAETQLVEIIKKDFPNLYIKENDRTVLNGLELDLYIPDKNVGIELNGPCHYIPIFGEEELSKTKNKDIIKKETMQKLKIHFFQINIMGAGKKLPEILNNAYTEYIKPLLL